MAIAVAIIVGILILLFLVFIHELGHFTAAKIFGIKVLEFGFGFPPKAWGKKIGETVYSINWIPAGGFVRLLGEEEESDDPASFQKKSPWIRLIVVVSGVVINFLFAVFLFYILLGFNGFKLTTQQPDIKIHYLFGEEQNYTFVADVDKDSPAYFAGVKQGDKILSLDGVAIENSVALKDLISKHLGEEVSLDLQNIKENNTRAVKLIPRISPPKGQGAIGVALAGDFTQVSFDRPAEKAFAGFMQAANTLQFQIVGISGLVGKSVQEKSAAPIAKNVAGPIAIVTLLAKFLGLGGLAATFTIISLVALISLVLSFINILPIPALDGGRFYFILAEALFGKKINPRLERVIHGAFFILLIVLFILVAFNDIINIHNYF